MKEQTWVMGKNCIREILKRNPKNIQKIFSSQKSEPILRQAVDLGIPIQFVSKQLLSSMVNSDSHQGFLARLHKRVYIDLKTFLETPLDRSFVLMCDGITDPQNFGAILRAAACFGANAVLFSKNRGVGITPVVAKASVGASELVPLLRVSNLAESLKQFQKAGYQVVTADADQDSQRVDTFVFPKKSVLIMGSEHRGVQPLLTRLADVSVKIPLLGQIDSLNVSQAASILLFKASLTRDH